MPPLPMSGPCFWPQRGQAPAHTLLPSASLLGVAPRDLGPFCTEEGFILWVPRCPEGVAPLGLRNEEGGESGREWGSSR